MSRYHSKTGILRRIRLHRVFWSLAVLQAFLSVVVSASEHHLKLGVFPQLNPQITTQQFTPLVQYLSKELHRPVQLEVSKDFESFWESVTQERYDIVHYNQYHYVRSARECGYRVILKNEEYGKDSVASVLIVRKDSGIQSIKDLRSKKVVFGDGPSAMVSYIQNTYLLRQAGLQHGDYQREYAISPQSIISYDFEGMNEFIREVSQEEDVVYAVLVASNGVNLPQYLDETSPYVTHA